MKYKGKTLVHKNSTVVKCKKGDEELEFIVTPLPMGWWQKLQTIGISIYPEPKKVALRDSNGTVVRNKSTGKAEVTELVDEEYKKLSSLVSRRLRVLQLVAHLRDDSNWEFEAKQPETLKLEDWQDYADQLLIELETSTLTEEEVATIVNEGEQLGCILSIEEVADDLLLSPM